MKKFFKTITAWAITTTLITVSIVPAFADELITEDILLSDTENLLIDSFIVEDSAVEDTTGSSDTDNPVVQYNKNNDKIQYILENDPGVICKPVENTSDILDDGSYFGCDGVSQIDPTANWPLTNLNTEEREWTIKHVKEIVDEIITQDMSDLEKYWVLADWMVENIDYSPLDSELYINTFNTHETLHGAYGTLKYKQGVCQGQTYLYSLLCHAADLPCDEILTKRQYNHILNYIPNINGYSYYLDITRGCFLNSDKAHSEYAGPFYEDYVDKNGKNIQCTNKSFDIYWSSGDLYIQPFSVDMYHHNKQTFDDMYKVLIAGSDYDGNYLTVEPYVEKGSGIRGQHIAHYADYALLSNENTGNWELDDFYMFPKSQLENYVYLNDVTISGLEKTVAIDELEEYKEMIPDLITLSYNGQNLIQGSDYVIDWIEIFEERIEMINGQPWINPKRIGVQLKAVGGIYYGSTDILILSSDKTEEPSPEPAPQPVKPAATLKFTQKAYYINDGDTVEDIFDGPEYTTYSSNKPSIVTVDDKGTIKGIAKGSAKITAFANGKKYSVNVTVSSPALSGTDTLLINNKTAALKIVNGRGKTQWSSSDPAVVTVDKNGKVKALSKGSATITAMNNGRTMTKVITTYAVPKFEQKVYTTNTDEPITVALTKDEDMDGVIYTMNNTKIATIDENGLVTPLKKGTVTVMAKIAGVTYKTTVKIFDPVINGKDTVKTGKTLGLSIKNGYGKTQWSVDDETVATITAKGKLKGISSGTVVVTAVNNGRTMTKEITVE